MTAAALSLCDPFAADALEARVVAAFAPPPKLTVSEFADAEIVLAKGPRRGRWRTDYAPYQRGIMDAMLEPGIEIVVVKGSSQWGKTACALNVIGFHIAHDPCDILVVQPTVYPMAEEFSKNRLGPIIDASPALSRVVGKKRSKDASNTTLEKTFVGGSIAISGANSAASLAARPVRLLVLDEPNRYPAELPGEGNPIAIAMERTSAYDRRRRIFMCSSPTVEGGAIDAWFDQGDQRRYHVPCPACGVLFAYEWKQVRWTDGDPSTARIHCPACDFGLDDVQRVAVLPHGAWVPENPSRVDSSIVSFHIWSAYSPMTKLRSIVAKFLRARADQKRGNGLTMETFGNTTLGEATKAKTGEAVAESSSLLARRETYAAEVPDGVAVLMRAVDTQDDRLEILVMGFGLNNERWFIDHRILDGDTSQEDVWSALEDVLDVQYRHPGGAMLEPRATVIDSAGHRTTNVYDFVATHAVRRVYAIIGRAGMGSGPIASRPSPRRWGRGQRQVKLYTINADAAKRLMADGLKLEQPGPGYIHFPVADWCDQEFVDQLTSEHLITHYHKGVAVQTWQKTRARNEVWDLAVYCHGAMGIERPNLPALAAKLSGAPAPPAPTTPPSQPAASPTPKWIQPRPGGWLKGRR